MIDGTERTLCLTLGALAEIETVLGCSKLKELDLRMRALSAQDLLLVLAALLRGSDSELAERLGEVVVAPGAAAKAVARAFALGLGE